MITRHPATTWRSLCLAITALVLLAGLAFPAAALKNPAAVYCIAMGYQNTIAKDTGGNDVDMCIMPDGKAVDGWMFLKGTVAQQYSWCAKHGYGQKTVFSRAVCGQFLTDSCAVCVAKDAKETEVTRMMGLSFEEATCGDGICGAPENFESCPQDCPHGSMDQVCESGLDGRCDPDCTGLISDPDCALKNPFLIVGLIVLVVLVIIVILYLRRKR
jgi:putative hemolysin